MQNKIQKKLKTDASSYCPVCDSCGEEGCCSPIICKQNKDGKYCDINLLHLKFGYLMYQRLFDLVSKDGKYKKQVDKIFDETYQSIYK